MYLWQMSVQQWNKDVISEDAEFSITATNKSVFLTKNNTSIKA